jgi:hypothetical protein
MRFAASVLLLCLSAVSGGKPHVSLFDDSSKDTLFVLVFPPDEGEVGDDGDEAWSDLEYHVGSALAKRALWRWIEVSREKDPADWKRFNPKSQFMFVMRYRGKTVLTSTGVLEDSEIIRALQANGLVPPYPLIPDGFVATYRATDSAAGAQYEYEFLDSTFSLQRFTPDEGGTAWSGSYRMAIDTLKFHFKSSRRDGKETAGDERHACMFTWTRDTLMLLNPCPVVKACDSYRRNAWTAIAGKGNSQSGKLVLIRSR